MNIRMLFLLCCISFGIYSTLPGQVNIDKVTIEGRTLDSQTKEIPYVNIYFLKSNSGTNSDANGDFTLQVNKEHFSDTLVFSAIGYKTFKISITNVLNGSKKIFYLEADVQTLDEVTVSAKSAVEIIKMAMDARKKNYGTSPHKLSGIYRITDQEDGAYVRLLECAIDVYDHNYMKKNSRIVDYLAIRQSKDFRTFKWKVDKLNIRNVDELLKPDLIKRPTRATHPNGFERGFFYAFESYALLDDEPVYVISATKNPDFQWPNYDAIFYVRAKDLAILRVDRDYSIQRQNWAKAPNVNTQITRDQLILKYKEIDGKLYLSYFLWHLKGDIINEKSNDKITSFERNEELNIHSVSLTKLVKKPKVWDDDIYEFEEPYIKSFWENYPTSNTRLFLEVSDELDKKKDLDEQFLSSDDKYSVYDPTKKFSIRKLKEDFKLFQKSLEEGHPSLYRYTTSTDFSTFFENTYKNISTPLTEVEFYRLLTTLTARINCGHTRNLLSEDYYSFYKNRNFYFPLQTKYFNGKLITSKGYFTNDTLPVGSEIVSVNGEALKDIKNLVDGHIPTDGYIQSAKDKIFGDHFAELYSIYYYKKDEFITELRMPDGKIVLTSIPGISYSQYYLQKDKALHSNRYEIIKPGVALIKVGSFTDSPELDFKEWVENSFSEIKESNVNNLIIDLRDNNGGRDDYALFLYSFLTSDTFKYHEYLEAATNNYSFLSFTDQGKSFNDLMHSIVRKDSTGRFLLNKSHPTLGIHSSNAPEYNQNVFFLINGNTFSAAADFAAVARSNERGAFIGQETGGAAIGNTSNGELIITLPNTGIRLKVPLFKIVNAVDPQDEGRGVIPDHIISYDYQDIFEKRDKELDFALRLISE